MINPGSILLGIASNSYSSECIFGGSVTSSASLNTGNWIGINFLVILLSFSIAAIAYSISNIFPASTREKMKGAAKFEAFQGLISVAIIIVLIAFSSVTCNIGSALVASSAQVTNTTYQNPMQFAESYIGNLMFSQGLSLFSQIYTESVLLAINANLASIIDEALENVVEGFVSISFSPGLMGTLFGFSGALGSTFEALIVVSFGVLFMIYLLLPMIQSLALTVIVPLALIMRSIPFAGPKLRESSDTFLSLAVGFYFILPLAILMNSYLFHWIYTSCNATTGSLCNPYSQFTAAYKLQQVDTNQLFNTPPQKLGSATSPLGNIFASIQIPNSFLSSSIAQGGGILGGLVGVLEVTYALPQIMVTYSLKTAEYVFNAIFLIGLDLAITLAFSQGLTKGLNGIGRMLSVGPFW